MKLTIELTEEELHFITHPDAKDHIYHRKPTYYEMILEQIRQKLVDSYLDEDIRSSRQKLDERWKE